MGPTWARWRHTSSGVDRAQRKPEKIWRRIGRSQLRNVVRALGVPTPNDEPRSIRKSPPKKTSEYSLYGNGSKPG